MAQAHIKIAKLATLLTPHDLIDPRLGDLLRGPVLALICRLELWGILKEGGGAENLQCVRE